MEQYGFFVNTDICTGCKACMTSCFDRNNLEVPQKFRKVFEFGGGEWKADEAGAFTATAFTYYVSMTCGHCENPACVANCPTGAMTGDLSTRKHAVIDEGACVEVPALATRDGIVPDGVHTLPQHLSIFVGNTAKIEELAVRAAIEGDAEKVFQAILFDPLTSAVLSMDETRRMVREMLDQNAPFLTYFKSLDF